MLALPDSVRFSRLVASVQLMVYAQILALGGAFLVGLIQAYKRGSWFDRLFNGSRFQFVTGYYLAVRAVKPTPGH